MMDCPRCGFSQPEDRYCANCGLDIAQYQAKPQPLVQRLIKSPTLFLGLAVGMVVGIVIYIQNTQFHKASQIPQVPPAPNLGSPLQAASPTPEPQPKTSPPSLEKIKPETPVTAKELISPTPSPPQAESTAQPEAPARPTPPPAAEVKAPTQLEVVFYEVPRVLLNQILAEAKLQSDLAARTWLLNSREKAQNLLTSARRLTGGRNFDLQLGNSLPLQFSGPASGEGPTGFFLALTPLSKQGAQFELEIAGQIFLKPEAEPGSGLPAPNPVQNRFDLMTPVPFGGAVILNNFLPRQQLPSAQDALFVNSPLAVLNSPEFLSNETELILLVFGR